MLSLFSLAFNNESNEDKINSIYDKYINLIFYIVSGFFQNSQDIEDAVYEILQKLIKNINCIENVHSNKTKAFISTVAKNTCITIKNKQSKIKEVCFDEINEYDFSIDNVEQEVIENETFYAYKKVLLSLPEIYYEIIYLKFHENLPLNKIAKILSISNDVAYQRFHRAKKMLAKLIEKELDNE